MLQPIIAISTPLGFSAIGIIRISFGDYDINYNFFFNNVFKKIIPYRIATLVNVYDKNNFILDKGLVIFFKKPFSYTGEFVLEFHGHGNPYNLNFLLNYFLDILKNYKIRIALPGEFTKRAFLNKKVNLLEIRNIFNIININNNDSLKLLHNSLKFNFFLKIKKIIKIIELLLIKLNFYLSFNIFNNKKSFNSKFNYKINYILLKISFIIKKFINLKNKKDISIIISGYTNVGKSTLFNNFLKRDYVLVSSIPGTTRDSINKNITLNNYLNFNLIDSAGFNNSFSKLDKSSIKITYNNLKNSDIIIYLFDNNNNFFNYNFFLKLKKKFSRKIFLEIYNKIDLYNSFVSLEFFLILKKNNIILNISAKYKLGVNFLYNELLRISYFISRYKFYDLDELFLKKLILSKKYIFNSLNNINDINILHKNLYKSYNNLNYLISNNHDYLNINKKIFNKFCVGK